MVGVSEQRSRKRSAFANTKIKKYHYIVICMKRYLN